MEGESQTGRTIKLLLATFGLGAIAAMVVGLTSGRDWLIWVALAIVILALLLFGGYALWWRLRSRREHKRFSAAIETQTSAAPKSIGDPNSRAKLDQLRQKFQKGLHEFKSRGKDIYKLPWYVIIGEPGSGKTEALRHSGIEFPPGLQDELQGSGGTVNMDWWFTNRAIILDTAGSMIFNEARAGEAPEWREFLRLLQKSRPHSPINGLFLVLSIESLIKDSAETIAQKSSRLAQQLDLIQKTLNVRFPVYLLVTKCDLLTGFREFFDSIDDPLLQHQMFGWSNPSPLDDHFRPDLVEQYLKSIVERLRRRRLALLGQGFAGARPGETTHFYHTARGPAAARRLDEVDSMFALPESMMRLAPRLRRYLETIFVAGEWSAKPVFLRGIYFTTSMREGKALDEAIALATGLPLDQLPEDRLWEKNRAFFLRDLFHEKVFPERGLVTHATNTLKLLRARQLWIFGTASVALLLLLAFGWYGGHNLGKSIGNEAKYWQAGATHWSPEGIWLDGSIVSSDPKNPNHFVYNGTNVPGTKLTVVDYHRTLRKAVTNKLSGGWIFKPMLLMGRNVDKRRAEAQRVLFEAGVLRPLIKRTRDKMEKERPTANDPAAVIRQKDALLSLMQLEADGLGPGSRDAFVASTNAAKKNLDSLLAYLTAKPNSNLDPGLVAVFYEMYSDKAKWPPKSLLSGGSSLSNNSAISAGLKNFQSSTKAAHTNILRELELLDDLTDKLKHYSSEESKWVKGADSCAALEQTLRPAKASADDAWVKLRETSKPPSGFMDLTSRYTNLATKAKSVASASGLAVPLELIKITLPAPYQEDGLFPEIEKEIKKFGFEAEENVLAHYKAQNVNNAVADLDKDCISTNKITLYELRWQLYADVCFLEGLANNSAPWTTQAITNARNRFVEIEERLKPANTAIQRVNLDEVRRKVGASKQRILKAIEDDLRRRVRFPVSLLDPNVSMSLDAVRDLRALLDGLTTEVTDPVWQSDNPATVAAIQKRLEKYPPIVRLLVTTNGRPRNWEISFVGPKRGSEDRTITSVYRFVQVIMADANALNDLTQVDPGTNAPIGKASVDHGIKIRFKNSPGAKESPADQKVDYQDWGLLRLIRANPRGRSEDGLSWTIPILLTDRTRTGNAVFEVHPEPKDPLSKESLPKFEDWRMED